MAFSRFLSLVISINITLSLSYTTPSNPHFNTTLPTDSEGRHINQLKDNSNSTENGWCGYNEDVTCKGNKTIRHLLDADPNRTNSEMSFDHQDADDEVYPGYTDISLTDKGNVTEDQNKGDQKKGGYTAEENKFTCPVDDYDCFEETKTELEIHIYNDSYAYVASEIIKNTGIYPVNFGDWGDLADTINLVWNNDKNEGNEPRLRVWDPSMCWPGYVIHYREYMNNGTYQEFDPRVSNWTDVQMRLNRLDLWPKPKTQHSEVSYDPQDAVDEVYQGYTMTSLTDKGHNVTEDQVHKNSSIPDSDPKAESYKAQCPLQDADCLTENKTELSIHIYNHPHANGASEILKDTGIYPVNFEDWGDEKNHPHANVASDTINSVWSNEKNQGDEPQLRIWDPMRCWPAGYVIHYREYMDNGRYQAFDPRTSNWKDVQNRLNRLDLWPMWLCQSLSMMEVNKQKVREVRDETAKA